MDANLIEEISAKSAALPLDKQREVLDFIEFVLQKSGAGGQEGDEPPRPFETMEGLLPRRIEGLEKDLAEVRREMWQNFPREEPK
jgi:hypothetical protein